MPRPLAACFFFVLLFAAPLVGYGDEADVKEAVSKLLDTGWQNTIKARAATSLKYKELLSLAPGDNRVTYAYALIQVKRRDYPEAVKLIDEVLAADKGDRHAMQAKSWLLVITKSYSSALVELDRLSQLLPESEASRDEEQHLELARYLGRVFGFLEGPVADAVNPTQRDAAKMKVLARLSEPRQTAFEEGRARVLAAFNELGTEKDESQDKAKAVAEEEREKLIVDIDARKQQIAARRAEIAPRRDELRSQLDAENDRFSKDQQPLLTQLGALDAQAAGFRRELDIIASDILRLRALLAKEKDPLLRDRLLRDLDRANRIAARADANVVAFQQQAAAVNAQLAVLQQKHAQAQSRLAGEFNRLDNELAGLDKQERRNDVDSSKAKKPAVGDVRRARSLSAQAAAFTTYEEFPLEAERQRLLDSYP